MCRSACKVRLIKTHHSGNMWLSGGGGNSPFCAFLTLSNLHGQNETKKLIFTPQNKRTLIFSLAFLDVSWHSEQFFLMFVERNEDKNLKKLQCAMPFRAEHMPCCMATEPSCVASHPQSLLDLWCFLFCFCISGYSAGQTKLHLQEVTMKPPFWKVLSAVPTNYGSCGLCLYTHGHLKTGKPQTLLQGARDGKKSKVLTRLPNKPILVVFKGAVTKVLEAK